MASPFANNTSSSNLNTSATTNNMPTPFSQTQPQQAVNNLSFTNSLLLQGSNRSTPDNSMDNPSLNSSSSSNQLGKQLASATLSKALTKPPPLSSVLSSTGPKSATVTPNSSAASLFNGLPPPPGLLQQQQSLPGVQKLTNSVANMGLSGQTPPSMTPNVSSGNLFNISTTSSANSSTLELNNVNLRTDTPPASITNASNNDLFTSSLPATSSAHLFQAGASNQLQQQQNRSNLLPQPSSAPTLVPSSQQTQPQINFQSSQPALSSNAYFTRSLDTAGTQQLFNSAPSSSVHKFSPLPATPLSTPFPSSNALFTQQQQHQQTTNLLGLCLRFF
jgi:hypothetical protein